MQINTNAINVMLYLYINRLSKNLAAKGIPEGSPAEKLIIKTVVDTLNEVIAEYGGK